MRYLLIVFLLIGCGKALDVNVQDSEHTVIHKIDLSDIQKICEEQNGTNEEIENCIKQYKNLLNIKTE